MRIWRTAGCAACIILAFAWQAGAQPPGRGWGGNPFFDALREAHQANPDREILEMLNHDEVRRLVRLSDPDWQNVQETLHQVRGKMEALRDEIRDAPELDKQVIKGKIIDALAPIEKAVFGVLREKADFDRLLGIYVQARETRAAAADQIAQRIGLEGDELERFRKLRSKKWGELMEQNQSKIRELLREPGGRTKIGQLFQHSEKELEATLKNALSEEQIAALNALKGAEIQDARRMLDSRPPGGGRGGRGGGRSSEGRPGEGRGRPGEGGNRGDHESRGGDHNDRT